MLLRYFDIRTLSIIFNPQNKFFTASQEAAIAGAIEKFAWINRFGKFCSYAPAYSNQAATALILNDHQWKCCTAKVCPIRFGQKYRKIIQATVRSLQQYIAGFLNCWRKRMSYREALLIWFSLSEKISKMFERTI